MKNIIHKSVICLFTLISISCSKDQINDSSDLVDPNTLTFKIQGYNDFETQATTTVNDKRNINQNIIDKGVYSVLTSFDEVNNNYSVKQDLKSHSPKLEKQATTNINTTSFYRLIVFEKNTKKLIVDKTVKADTIGKVKVARNIDYDWIAYTYNDSQEITNSSVIVNNNSIITAIKHTTIQNKPFMVARGSSKISEDNSLGIKQQNVAILFKQKTARMRVKVDISNTRSNAFLVNGTIVPQSSKTYHGVYDFLTGTEGAYESHKAYNQNHILYVPANQDVQIAYSDYQYTSKTDPLGNYTLKLSTKWRYKVPPNIPQPSDAEIKDISLNPTANSFDYMINSNLEYAKNYEFTMKVKLANYVEFNGIFWARYDLKYTPSNGSYVLRDSHIFPEGSYQQRDTVSGYNINTNRGTYPGANNPAIFKPTTNRTDYFRPGYYNISDDNTGANASKDPCKKLEDGKWRLPTKSDYENLVTNSTSQRLGLFENIYYIKENNETNIIINDRVNFFRYGRLDLSGSNNSVWTPARVGYTYIYPSSNQIDDGVGLHLYKNGEEFGVFSTGFHTEVPSPFPIHRFLDNISSGAKSAYSVRCVRDVKY